MHTIYLNSDVAEPLSINGVTKRLKTIYESHIPLAVKDLTGRHVPPALALRTRGCGAHFLPLPSLSPPPYLNILIPIKLISNPSKCLVSVSIPTADIFLCRLIVRFHESPALTRPSSRRVCPGQEGPQGHLPPQEGQEG